MSFLESQKENLCVSRQHCLWFTQAWRARAQGRAAVTHRVTLTCAFSAPDTRTCQLPSSPVGQPQQLVWELKLSKPDVTQA